LGAARRFMPVTNVEIGLEQVPDACVIQNAVQNDLNIAKQLKERKQVDWFGVCT
jgi:hypothetical protein